MARPESSEGADNLETDDMTMNTGKYYVTGGTGARDHTYLACQDALTDRGAWDALLLSGPIDAPEVVPAGGCTRESHRNGFNSQVPSILYSMR